MPGLDDSVYLYGEHVNAGGHTICVDVIVRNAVVSAAHIRGDFSLKPDTAYDAVNLVLGNAPFFARAEDMANEIQTAMGDKATLENASIDDIAQAMRNALDSYDPPDYF